MTRLNNTPSKTSYVRLPKLHTGQRRSRANRSRFHVNPCGRGWGKSTDAVYELGMQAVNGRRWHYGAPDYRRVEEVYSAVLKALKPIVTINQYARRIETIMDGKIEFWTLNDETAGQSRHDHGWIIDEAGLVPNLMGIWRESIRPSLTRHNGRAIFYGTPKGWNDYHTIYQMALKSPDWSTYTASSYDNPYIDPAELDRLKDPNNPDGMTEAQYQQEILAQFLKAGAGVFPYVNEAVYGEMLTLQALEESRDPLVIGVDLGKKIDKTVFTAITPQGKVPYLETSQADYLEQIARLEYLCKTVNIIACVIEDNVGEMFIERAKQLRLPVVRFHTSAQTKTPLIERLVLAFEQGRIKIPNHRTLLYELMAFESKRLPSGGVQYSAPAGQHDDTVMSLALAYWGINQGRSWSGFSG